MFLVPVSRRPADVSRLLDQTFQRFFSTLERGDCATVAGGDADAQSPNVDVVETDGAWTLRMDLPGVAKDDVKVSIDGRRVHVEAAVKSESERKDGERVVYRERTASRYARTFTLPSEIDQSQSQAKLENGVLELALTKRQPTTAAQLTVN